MSESLKQRIRESIRWLSVQVQIFWGFVWFMYSQLPSETMVKLAQVQFTVGPKEWAIAFTVPSLMGLAHAATTYFARIKKAPAPKPQEN